MDVKRDERWDVHILLTQLIDIICNGELRNDMSNSLTLDFKFQTLEYDVYLICLYRAHTHILQKYPTHRQENRTYEQ